MSMSRCFCIIGSCKYETIEGTTFIIITTTTTTTTDGNTTPKQKYMDLCLISDCIHFTNFHGALLATIARLLKIHGKAILCQPKRGTSLDLFLELLRHVNDSAMYHGEDKEQQEQKQQQSSSSSSLKPCPLFQVQLIEKYDDTVTSLHEKSLIDHVDTYDVNKHYPFMLLLTKMREYDEEKDTLVIEECIKSR
uniref:Calmodulin-lysine N-methyltransferase n=1 Tax=Ditylum brightwellii TaxID=49249 RepID=A0A7S1ZSX3_9STRA|mmetsp:Transcript_37713/g.56428  ORF Transcript_37713/g.56428 Transcript_37713/m.56428 type:complete len:193 (+) Transcript_37713:320-898(+)